MSFFKTAEEETVVAKRQSIIDEEVRLYELSQKTMVNRLVDEYRRTEFRKVEEASIEANKDIKRIQSDFFQVAEIHGIQLAKLDAHIENKSAIIAKAEATEQDNKTLHAEMEKYKAESAAKDGVIASQKETITLLDNTVKVVVAKLSTIDIKSLGLNVTTTAVKEK